MAWRLLERFIPSVEWMYLPCRVSNRYRKERIDKLTEMREVRLRDSGKAYGQRDVSRTNHATV